MSLLPRKLGGAAAAAAAVVVGALAGLVRVQLAVKSLNILRLYYIPRDTIGKHPRFYDRKATAGFTMPKTNFTAVIATGFY